MKNLKERFNDKNILVMEIFDQNWEALDDMLDDFDLIGFVGATHPLAVLKKRCN